MNKRKKERHIKQICKTTLTQIYLFFREEVYYKNFMGMAKFQPKCWFLAPHAKSELWIGLFYQTKSTALDILCLFT